MPCPYCNTTNLSSQPYTQSISRGMTTTFEEPESSIRLNPRHRSSEDSSTLCGSAIMEHSEPLLGEQAQDRETESQRQSTWSRIPFLKSRNTWRRKTSDRAVESDILGRMKASRRCLTFGVVFLAILYVLRTITFALANG